MWVLCVVLLSLCWGPTHTQEHTKNTLTKYAYLSASLNPLLDEITDNFRNSSVVNGLDPLALPDLEGSVSKKIIFINVNAHYSLSNGTLENLKTIQRYGNDSKTTYAGKVWRINAAAQVDSLKFLYHFEADVLGFSLKGNVTGGLTLLALDAELQMNINDLTAELTDLDFIKTGTLTVRVETSKATSLIVNSILKVITTLFEGLIMREIKSTVKSRINEILRDLFATTYLQLR